MYEDDCKRSLRERWSPVLDYEGYYEASSLGRIRSVDRDVPWRDRSGTLTTMHCRGKILSQCDHIINGGPNYRQVSLSMDGKGRISAVHSLVAGAFLGPRPEGYEVAHYDGDSTNNAISNLRYATRFENLKDKIRHGKCVKNSEFIGGEITSTVVTYIRSSRDPGRALARRFLISESSVSRIRNRKIWRHVE